MTFYNVISALIFLGAFREFLSALQGGDLCALSRASLVALFVFNDAIFTSWTIEARKKDYGPNLMVIDSLNFTLISFALIFLNPGASNIFQLDLTQLMHRFFNEAGFWLILAVYWSLIMLWTWVADVYNATHYPTWLIKYAAFISGFLLIEAILAECLGSSAVSWVTCGGSLFIFVYAAVYILVVRAIALWNGIDRGSSPIA